MIGSVYNLTTTIPLLEVCPIRRPFYKEVDDLMLAGWDWISQQLNYAQRTLPPIKNKWESLKEGFPKIEIGAFLPDLFSKEVKKTSSSLQEVIPMFLSEIEATRLISCGSGFSDDPANKDRYADFKSMQECVKKYAERHLAMQNRDVCLQMHQNAQDLLDKRSKIKAQLSRGEFIKDAVVDAFQHKIIQYGENRKSCSDALTKEQLRISFLLRKCSAFNVLKIIEETLDNKAKSLMFKIRRFEEMHCSSPDLSISLLDRIQECLAKQIKHLPEECSNFLKQIERFYAEDNALENASQQFQLFVKEAIDQGASSCDPLVSQEKNREFSLLSKRVELAIETSLLALERCNQPHLFR